MAPRRQPKRDADISAQPGIKKRLLDVFDQVDRGFEDQRSRSDDLLDNWDLFNCKLTDKQFYNGNSRIFLPLIKDAVNARKTRFLNQLFPVSGRYVEATGYEEDIPQATMSLLESYVRKTKLRTQIAPALLKNGDVEGQYSLYVSWKETTRNTVNRQKVADQPDFPELGEHDEFKENDDTIGRPDIEVLHDADLLVLPATADSIEDAIDAGGSVTVLRRWSKGRIRRAIKDGDITSDDGEALIKAMTAVGKNQNRDTSKAMTDAAGIKNNGDYAQVYETWTKLKVRGEEVLCRAYKAEQILGCKRSPYWCDRVPIISVPVEKVAGAFKGRPPVADVADLQVLANDTINEGADTAHFSAMPIVMTDPEKNPRVASMVLGLAAVWETNPNDTQFAQFPELWSDALNRVEAIKGQIMQTLGVNPSMVPGSTGGDNKRNQAEIANEQQVDILTTADAVTVLEEGVFTPLIQWFAELDHQFRDEDVTVRVYGEMGVRAHMERVEPIQLNNRWEFRWYGVEAGQNVARQQQQIAGLNVIKGIPPEMYPDYELDVTPMVIQMAEDLWGPRLAPLIFKKKQLISVDPMLENELMDNGFPTQIHEADDDMAHIQAHMAGMAQNAAAMGNPDPHGVYRDHITLHQQQLQKKQSMAMQAQALQAPGAPGGPGGAGPGVAGTPRPGPQPGAQPAGPRLVKGPPGMIHPDQMPAAGAVSMPRKM